VYEADMLVFMGILVVYVTLFLTGLCFGSFAGATVWRLRANSLALDKLEGSEVNFVEYRRLSKLINKPFFSDRSQCLDCTYVLKWYDLIPLVSWMSLGGKCRKCRQTIGYFELIIELGVAAYYVLSFAFWPYPLTNGFEIARIVLWLIAGVPLAISFAYDTKWLLLDKLTNHVLIAVGLISAMIVVLGSNNMFETILSIIGSIAILSGLYYLLYKISRGKWVGDGDYMLGLGLALLLADWKLAFIALFAANLVGCIVVLPGLITKKLKRTSHVPFGPLLIIGFFIAGLMGNYILNFIFTV
jgi:leader peptidase (prepilin peptidase)/N-methyltransferase